MAKKQKGVQNLEKKVSAEELANVEFGSDDFDSERVDTSIGKRSKKKSRTLK